MIQAMRPLLLLLALHLAWPGDLAQRGQARFTYWWIDVYDVTLFLPATLPADQVLTDVRRRIAFRYCRAFTAAELAQATTRTMRERRGAMDAAAFDAGLAAINACWRDVVAGSYVELDYDPARGTAIRLDGRELGVVPGAELARVLFSVWLGEDPIDHGLRRRLLGG